MTDLESIWAKWINLYDELCRDPNFKGQIAEPLISIPAMAARSILYVGKATSKDGPCGEESAHENAESLPDRINQRRKHVKRFLECDARSYGGGFWPFARKLNTLAADKWKTTVLHPVQHVIWTNVFKIGAQDGNPKGELGKRQQRLAVETLKVEIVDYRPELIYIATGNEKVADEVIGLVLDDPGHTLWKKDRGDEGLWWRNAKDGLPPAVWTGHPERKARATWDVWLSEAIRLLPDAGV